MKAQRYILWIHDAEALNWMWDFEYPKNVKLFGTDVRF